MVHQHLIPDFRQFDINLSKTNLKTNYKFRPKLTSLTNLEALTSSTTLCKSNEASINKIQGVLWKLWQFFLLQISTKSKSICKLSFLIFHDSTKSYVRINDNSYSLYCWRCHWWWLSYGSLVRKSSFFDLQKKFHIIRPRILALSTTTMFHLRV